MDKLHINHITIDAVNRTMSLCSGFKRSEILKILSKALNFKSIGYLTERYTIDKEGYMLLEGDNQDYVPYDMLFRGLFFNENVLMIKLKISYERAKRLKSYIDKPFYESCYDGSIGHSDLSMVKYGLKQIHLEKVARIMAEYPFRFYSRRRKDFCIELNSQKHIVSFFNPDSFYPSDRKYFRGDKNMKRYVIELLGLFLQYDNVMFTNDLISDLDERELEYLEALKNKYDSYEVHFPFEVIGFRSRDGLFFPSTKLTKEALLFYNHS